MEVEAVMQFITCSVRWLCSVDYGGRQLDVVGCKDNRMIAG